MPFLAPLPASAPHSAALGSGTPDQVDPLVQLPSKDKATSDAHVGTQKLTTPRPQDSVLRVYMVSLEKRLPAIVLFLLRFRQK